MGYGADYRFQYAGPPVRFPTGPFRVIPNTLKVASTVRRQNNRDSAERMPEYNSIRLQTTYAQHACMVYRPVV